jgi:hypothetical protein
MKQMSNIVVIFILKNSMHFPEFVLDGVRMVSAGLPEESIKVVCRWPCLVLAAVCGSRDVPNARATCFLIVAVV